MSSYYSFELAIVSSPLRVTKHSVSVKNDSLGCEGEGDMLSRRGDNIAIFWSSFAIGGGGEGFRDDRKFCGDGKSGNFVIFGFLILGEPIGEHVDFLQFSSVVHAPIFSYCS